MKKEKFKQNLKRMMPFVRFYFSYFYHKGGNVGGWFLKALFF